MSSFYLSEMEMKMSKNQSSDLNYPWQTTSRCSRDKFDDGSESSEHH